jgi:hypothetical protein
MSWAIVADSDLPVPVPLVSALAIELSFATLTAVATLVRNGPQIANPARSVSVIRGLG